MVTVREAVEADLPALMRLYVELAISGPPVGEDAHLQPQIRAAFADIKRDSRQALLVAEVDGQVAGTLALFVLPNLSYGGAPWAVIENVVVASAHRRRGVGRALMLEAIERARRAGCYKIQLCSNLQRREAHAFYESLGFKTTHRQFRMDL
jgi:GNAT superfamily N-acetyltransferase